MRHLCQRVLFVSTGLNRGGAEMQVFHLSKGMRARGALVEVVSMISGGNMADEFRAAGIPLHELGMARGIPDPRAVLRLRKVIRSFRPDIVHSHMVHANLLARLTRLICTIPVLIATAHSMTEGKRWTEIAYRLTDSLGDLTTIICDAAAKRYVQVGSVPADRLKVVVNGLPPGQFGPDPRTRAEVRQKLGIRDEFVWLAVGSFGPAKDYSNLIKAMTLLRPQGSLLLIAGDGPLRSGIEEFVCAQKVAKRIRFLGVRKDVPGLMAAVDGYVMSSAWEGLPMVLLEAAASGLPIVATDVGGNCEIVRHGVSGYLAPSSNPAALAQMLQQVEESSLSERAAMGAAGREVVTKKYSLSLVLDEWESIYRSLNRKKSHIAYAQLAH